MSVQVKRKTWLWNGETANTDLSSDVQDSYQVQNATVYIWWESGSSFAGTIQLWGRVNPESEKVGIFKSLTLSAPLEPTGASGSLSLNITEPLCQWYLKFVSSTGTADIYATWEGKSRG